MTQTTTTTTNGNNDNNDKVILKEKTLTQWNEYREKKKVWFGFKKRPRGMKYDKGYKKKFLKKKMMKGDEKKPTLTSLYI